MGLIVLASSPGVTVQDLGRPGWLAHGLSRGGAADPVALAEAAALLGRPVGLAAVELAGAPARFRATAPVRIALTGAPFKAMLHQGKGADVRALAWNASHHLPAGSELALTPAQAGFGYLTPAGGIETPVMLGSRSAHLAAGIGGLIGTGAELPLGRDPGGPAGMALDPLPRFGGGEIRAVESLQTALFDAAAIARLQRTAFRRDARGNRMGTRLIPDDGEGFAAPGGLSVVSEIVQPGDIQITGDGTPFVLLGECQTTGGYPRIATILPCDLPRLVQAQPGAALRIRMIGRDEARRAMAEAARSLAALSARVRPAIRDPALMPDLLSHNLVGGVISARDEGDDE